MTKKCSHRFTFPATKNIFIKAVQPDTAFDDAGVYQTTLVYDKEQADKLVKEIESLDPRLEGLIKYNEQDDGTCTFKVKQKRFVSWVGKDGQRQETEMKPRILTSDNKDYTGSEPWGGTIAEIGVLVETQKGARGKGIIAALRFKGMRIHELVTGGATEGDGDPMFGAPVPTNARVEDDGDDIPFDLDDDADNAPI